MRRLLHPFLLFALSIGPCARADPAQSAPDSLDALVAVALQRDPSAMALSSSAEAARYRARAAARPMDPLLMVGIDALGAMPDARDPTMGMVGATQMFGGWGSYRAATSRFEVDADRALADRERVEADLRAELWRMAAKLDALDAEHRLLDERVQTARNLLEIGLARYGAGAGTTAVRPAAPVPDVSLTGTAPPVVAPAQSARGGMAGMGAMGAMPMASGQSRPRGGMEMAASAMGGMGEMGGMSAAAGLGSLLRLDAEAARIEGQRDAIAARHEGERERLALVVGEESADAVSAMPTAFLGTQRSHSEPPEVVLAETDVRAALADLRVARADRNPDVMMSSALRVMPGPMFGGVDVGLGVTVPLWGGAGRRIDAANAALTAASDRKQDVLRDLALARAAARAELAAAESNARALMEVAVPRARQALDTTLALYGSDRATAEEAVSAWATALDVEREAISARRMARLMAADLDRLEGP